MGKEGTIIAPAKSNNVPANAQWLSGQGAGVWFAIESTVHQNQFVVQRFSPTGDLDCKRVFEVEQQGFDINKPYQFVHISHCAKCRIEQNNQVFVFNWIETENQ